MIVVVIVVVVIVSTHHVLSQLRGGLQELHFRLGDLGGEGIQNSLRRTKWNFTGKRMSNKKSRCDPYNHGYFSTKGDHINTIESLETQKSFSCHVYLFVVMILHFPD